MKSLPQQDPQVWEAIEAEAARQQDGLEMIASENYTSLAIMEAGQYPHQQVRRGLSGTSLLRWLSSR